MTGMFEAIRSHAAARPDAIAIDGGSAGSLTWRELREALAGRVRDIAAETAGTPVRPVALTLDQGLQLALDDLALLEAGIPAVPLPRFFTPAQRAAALASGGCIAVIGPEGVEGLDTAAAALPAGTAKISFTSGSTGTPKGICLSAEHQLSVARAVVEALGSEHTGRHLALLPPGILLENIAGFYATLLAGGTYIALPQAEVGLADPFRPDWSKMLATIAGTEATSLILVPEYLAGLVRAMEDAGTRLPRLTLVAVGGARIATSLIERAAAVGLPVRQGYGLTECGSVVTLEDGTELARGSVGRSLGSNRLRIASDGEIVIDGPAYLGTIGAPRTPGPLHTGDIGRIDATGRLWIEGRKSNLIVTSFGRNISPEWVESALTEQPAVLQALVRGDGAATLDALIVPATPDADIANAVIAANAKLPDYARVTRWQLVPPFTPMNGMLTGNGRLRREAIQAAYAARPDGSFFERLVAATRDAQARFAMVPQLQAGLTGRISRNDYVTYLAQAYHHVRHTVPLMQAARARLAHRPLLVEALDEYIAEETGHEAWILNDIDAAGGDGAAVAASDPAPATAAMVEHAYRTIRDGNPAAFFGMVFVLEGTSIAMASAGAGAVQARLGLPAAAFTYLTSHGALDQDHMRFFERLMNRVDDPDDQHAIIAMARDMFRLFGGMFGAIALEGDARVAA